MNASELPKIDNAPASEWARDAHSALDPSGNSNHGSSLPGAFPDADTGAAESAATPFPTGNGLNGRIIGTVKPNLPSQEDVIETVKQYLPGTVAAYLRGYKTVIMIFLC
jgi:hypothetical protein